MHFFCKYPVAFCKCPSTVDQFFVKTFCYPIFWTLLILTVQFSLFHFSGFNKPIGFQSKEDRKDSPECLHKAVHCHQHVIGALLRPAFGDGEDGPVDILRVGHDVTALSLCSTPSHLW